LANLNSNGNNLKIHCSPSKVSIPKSFAEKIDALGPHFCLVEGKDPSVGGKGWQKPEKLMFSNDPRLVEWVSKGGNYGVVCGYGLVVVEADHVKVKEAVEKNLPPTLVVLSGGRRLPHYYFLCSFPECRPLIDYGDPDHPNIGHIKGQGGMVVGPGSIHLETKSPYVLLHDRPIAQVTPQQLVEALKPFLLKREVQLRVETAVKEEKARLGDISIDILEVVPLAGLKRQGDEYYGPHPVHGSTTGRNFWVNSAKNCWHCFRHSSGGGPLLWLAVEEGIIDCAEAGPGALRGERFKQVLEIAVERGLIDPDEIKFKLDAEKRRFQPKPLKQLIEEAKPLEYICDPLIPKRSVIMLAGKAGVGKSMLALDLAHKVANGGKIFGRFEVSAPSKVLYIDEENNPSILRQRTDLLGLNPLEGIDCLVLEGFKLSEHIEQLEDILSSKEYSVIIIDNWTDASGNVDENRSWQVSGIFSELRRIAYEYDCTFVIIHHLRKNLPYVVNEIDELRGSSVLVNEPDLVLLLQKDELSWDRIVKTIKMRFGEPISFKISFSENEDGYLELKWVEDIEISQTESTVMECAKIIRDFLTLKRQAKRKEIVEAAQGFSESTVNRAIKLLLASGVVERVKYGVYSLKPTLQNFSSLSTIIYNITEKVDKVSSVEQRSSSNGQGTSDAEKQASNNSRCCWICRRPILEFQDWTHDISTGKPAHIKCLKKLQEGMKHS